MVTRSAGDLVLRSIFLLALLPGLSAAQEGSGASAADLGEYAYTISGCAHCHTAEGGEPLAGGRALTTPFGTFYSPNITAHPSAGIGSWSRDDFYRALHEGESPDGHVYFPAFPYTAYTQLTRADVDAIFDHIQSLPVSATPSRDHELAWYVDFRIAPWGWRWLFFDAGTSVADPARSDSWNRGAYIAEAMAHCQECHSPRDGFGVIRAELAYSGNPDGPDGEKVPNITPHLEAGIGDWREGSLSDFLRWGELPNGEYTSGTMEAVIAGVGKLSDADRAALIKYLQALPAIDKVVD